MPYSRHLHIGVTGTVTDIAKDTTVTADTQDADAVQQYTTSTPTPPTTYWYSSTDGHTGEVASNAVTDDVTSQESTTVTFPSNAADLPCSVLLEYGTWNFLFKYSKEELQQLICRCRGLCATVSLSPDIRADVHWELYGPLSDRNRPAFIAVVTVYSLLLLVGVSGNVTTVVGLVRWIKTTSPTFAFIISLAVSDLLLLSVCMPLKVTEYFHLADVFTEPTCKMTYYIRDFTLVCSVLTLTVISFERYYAICRPLSAKYRCTWSRARTMIVVTWCVSAALALPTIFMTKYYLPVGMMRYECLQQAENNLYLELYFIYYLGVMFALPAAVMTFTYGSSCVGLWRSARLSSEMQGTRKVKENVKVPKIVVAQQRDEMKSRRQVIKLLVLIATMFLLCWGTPLVVQLLSVMGFLTDHRDKIRLAAESLTYLSSAVNPYLFMAMSSQFRQSALRHLKCIGGQRERHYQHERRGTVTSTNTTGSSGPDTVDLDSTDF